MSTAALILVLAAALVHAAWNYHLKKAAAGRIFWLLCYSLTTAAVLPILIIANPSLFSQVTPTGWLVIVLSAPIHVLYAMVLQTGYRKSDYSIVYPTARGTGPFISVLAAVFFLGNTPSLAGWCGIFSILTGIVLLAAATAAPGENLRVKSGLLWGTLTGLFIAGYTFCDAWAVQQETGLTPLSFYFPSLFVRALILAPFVLLSAGWKKDLQTILGDSVKRRALIIVAIGSPLAFLLVLYAMTMAPLAYVAPARECGMMLGVIAGALLLHERLTFRRVLGAAAMTAGVFLIGAGG